MTTPSTGIPVTSASEAANRERFERLFDTMDMSTTDKIDFMGLFMRRQLLARYLFLNEIYQKILPVHGVIFEFGVRWGHSLALMANLRGIYEPFNYNRTIVGFDTFTGFPSVHGKDGSDEAVKEGTFAVAQDWDQTLTEILSYHESESPIPHVRKFELVKGDATKTLDAYLERNPQTIVSFAYFDFDIYEPTAYCLKRILPHLTKGSIIGFDELNHPAWPGETVALKEVLGVNNIRIQRVPYSPTTAFAVIE